MTSALSSAYVLLGKATLSDPPDWCTAVGAIHTLSSLLTCYQCRKHVGPKATPHDSFSLLCDKCHECTVQDAMLALLMDNIKNLCCYVLRAFQHFPEALASDDSDEDEANDDIVIVPTHSNSTKFVAKLRKFAKVNFDIVIKPEDAKKGEQVAVQQTPKAVIVTSPTVKSSNFSHGQWIKIHSPKPAKRSHVMINGSKFGRDQIVKTTLRPTLTYPFKPSNKGFNRLSDFFSSKANSGSRSGEFVVQLNQIGSSKMLNSKKGCRCGNATPTPGKLTCGGQRCPCYVESRSCLDCKCKGCRNPHKVNGEKVIRPQLKPTSSTFFVSSTSTSPQQQSTPNILQSKAHTFKRIHLN